MLGLLERYWLQPSVIVVTVAGFGLGAVLSYLSALAGNNNIVKYSLVTLAVFTAAFQVCHLTALFVSSDSLKFWNASYVF